KKCGHVFVLKAPGAGKPAAPVKGAPGKPAVPGAKGKPAAPPTKAPAAPAKPVPPPKGPDERDDAGPGLYAWQEEETSDQQNADPKKAAAEASSSTQPKYEDVDRNPYGITEIDLAPRCPFCAKEMESAEAIICVHCGYNTQTREMGKTVRTYANTGQETFLWLLPGILCVVAIGCLIGGICYLWLKLPDPNDPKIKEEWWTFSIRPAQVWGSIIGGLMIVGAGLFAFKRLVLNPQPPEKEKK